MIRIDGRAVVFLFTLLLVGGSALADTAPLSATDTVRQATRELYQALEKNQVRVHKDPQLLYELVEGSLLPYTDLQTMSRWVLGRYWRSASEDQRKRFEDEFRRLLVRTYSAAIQQAELEDIRYLPERPGTRDDRRVVRTEVKRKGQPPLPIDYYMHRVDGRWLLYDVRIEGVSLITNYRSSFASAIADKGLDALIREMAERNRDGVGSG